MDPTTAFSKNEELRTDRQLITAGVILGMGFAGFFDGIVLHQVLQWHHMLSSVHSTNSIAGLELNTLADGLFHIGALILTAIGLGLLWRTAQHNSITQSPKILIGSLLLGAGGFDVVEGLIDHQILGIHHVKPGPHQLAWDLGFLALGTALALGGWMLLQSASKKSYQ